MCQPSLKPVRPGVRILLISIIVLALIPFSGSQAAPGDRGRPDPAQIRNAADPPQTHAATDKPQTRFTPGPPQTRIQTKPKQDKALSAQGDLKTEVTVTLKLVQVFVTDAKGKPALDLGKADFVLYDNGKLQTITDFEKHLIGMKESAAEGRLPAGRDARSLMNRKFIFFIDYGRNDFEGIVRSQRAAVEFIDTKAQPGDEIALFSFSTASGLTLHEYFTADHAKVRAAIKKMRDIPGSVSTGMDMFAEFGHEATGTELMGAVLVGRHDSVGGGRHAGGRDTRDFFAEMREWAKALAHIPGQKSIIFFSRGFARDGFKPKSLIQQQFEAMVQGLASANAPVYTVETVRGVFPDRSLEEMSRVTGGKYLGDVYYSARIGEDIQNATGNYYVLGYRIGAAWDGRSHQIKVEVRKPGYAVYGQRGYFNPVPFNKLSEIEKHMELIDAALGERAYMGQRVSFPMIAVTYRNGGGALRDAAARAKSDGAAGSGVKAERGDAGSENAGAGLGRKREGGDAADSRNWNAFLVSEIPVRGIHENVGGNTEVITLVLDEEKTIVDGKRVLFDWSKTAGEEAIQYSKVALGPGRYDCRVIIRNLDDGRAAVGACALKISGGEAGTEEGGAADAAEPTRAASNEGFALDPPLLLVAGPEVKYLNFSATAKGKETGAGEDSLFDAFPFPAKRYRPLVADVAPGAQKLFAVVRCAGGRGGFRESEIAVSAWIASAGEVESVPTAKTVSGEKGAEAAVGGVELSGQKQGDRKTESQRESRLEGAKEGGAAEEPVPVEVLAVTRRGDVDVLLLDITLPELAAGRYVLHVSVGGVSAASSFGVGLRQGSLGN